MHSISGIGSTPNKIRKAITKILASLTGEISSTYFNDSGNLVERQRKINMKDKLVASFDVKSISTNISVKQILGSVQFSRGPHRISDTHHESLIGGGRHSAASQVS